VADLLNRKRSECRVWLSSTILHRGELSIPDFNQAFRNMDDVQTIWPKPPIIWPDYVRGRSHSLWFSGGRAIYIWHRGLELGCHTSPPQSSTKNSSKSGKILRLFHAPHRHKSNAATSRPSRMNSKEIPFLRASTHIGKEGKVIRVPDRIWF
jgi:hypothetical protein